ncbi:MAG: hypothetical protein H0X17_03955 [Deltaproteobacteria bacterium]|nr:hypothetical protein [Deltaproteobacteria bacterium]
MRAVSFMLVIAACGESPVTPDAPVLECPTTGRYFELQPGTRWTYRVVDDGRTSTKAQLVGEIEDVGGAKAGVRAHRLTTTRSGGEVVSWQEDRGDVIVRHRELDMAGDRHTDESYTPHRTRVDETEAHTAVGATWTESYTETITDAEGTTVTPKTETWLVEAVDEVLVVPAGAFCTLRVRRTSTSDGGSGSVKTYWFARGVGKVKEAATNQVEELLERVP